MVGLQISLLEPILLLALFACLGWQGLRCGLLLAQYFTGRPIFLQSIFVGLRPKLWMSAGLGAFFFALYVAILFAASHLLDASSRQTLLHIAHTHPVYCLYGGLLLFVAISLLIVGVRSIIKRIYNAKK